MTRTIVQTDAAPKAIGTYSQAVDIDGVVYLSGQTPMEPNTMELVAGDFRAQAVQVFENLKAVAEAAGGSLNDAVKLTIYMTDLNDFATVNEVMATFFDQPYPARTTIQVSALPKTADVEIDAILKL